jgi:UDP-N-acetylglucosamine transferase subunit ALG13
MIFVSIGTNEARFDRLLRAVVEIPLRERLLIQHGHSTPIAAPHVDLVAFLSFDALSAAIRDARAVVTHAGVGSVMVSLANGKRPIVVPRRKAFAEAVDDHQLELARRFAQAGLVTLVEDPSSLAAALQADQSAAPTVPRSTRLAAELREYIDVAIAASARPVRT